MPTSDWSLIEKMLDDVHLIAPKTILDVGIGFGKWGLLFREYTDIYLGRVFKEQWSTIIDGVEIFEKYIQSHQRYIYNNIYIGDILELELPNYELVYFGDVIEHIEKKKGEILLSKFKIKSKHLYISVPLNDCPQMALYGNNYEKHISTWKKEDFKDINDITIKEVRGKKIALVHYYNSTWKMN